MTFAGTEAHSQSAPTQAAGYRLLWRDEFNTLDVYHPTKNPNGRWRSGDFWTDPLSPGGVDFAATKSFNVNQITTDPVLQPYKPLSVSNGILRITARRAHLNQRPALRRLVNNIAVHKQGQQPDRVTWLGAWITAYRKYQSPQQFTRPAYVEARIKVSPGTQGLGGAFWLYTSLGSGSRHPEAEIDIFDLVGAKDRWYTHVHHSGSGPSFEKEYVQPYADGAFHVYGLHWTPGFLRVYRDNKLVAQFTGAKASWYVDPMRVIFSFAGDNYFQVPANIERMYMDVDWVRVWKG